MMGVYLDTTENELRGHSKFPMKTCHMIADSIDELFAMARLCGMKPGWFQPWSHPHFDLTKSRRKIALANGAVVLGRREFVGKMREYRSRLLEDKAERDRLWELTRLYGGMC